tara:strand:- start:142 stop:405 length:264 start_codon:yes stop_codon:yes gene_type:complete
MILLKFSCGCIGFRTGDKIIALYDCCDDEDVIFADMTNTLAHKAAKPLPEAEGAVLILHLLNLVADGHRLRQLQTAFQVAGLTGESK